MGGRSRREPAVHIRQGCIELRAPFASFHFKLLQGRHFAPLSDMLPASQRKTTPTGRFLLRSRLFAKSASIATMRSRLRPTANPAIPGPLT